MAHFAELDSNNVTLRCLVVSNEDILDKNGNETEAIGTALLSSIFGGNWVQTSYNKSFRKNFAGGDGWIWDVEKNMFYLPKPFPSWILDEETGRWESPISKDSELVRSKYNGWSEENQTWEVFDDNDEVILNTPENSLIDGTFPQMYRGLANSLPHSEFISGNIWY